MHYIIVAGFGVIILCFPLQMQNEYGHQASENVPKLLHPYDRASETLFSVSVLSFIFHLFLISLYLWVCGSPVALFLNSFCNKFIAKEGSVKYLYQWESATLSIKFLQLSIPKEFSRYNKYMNDTSIFPNLHSQVTMQFPIQSKYVQTAYIGYLQLDISVLGST